MSDLRKKNTRLVLLSICVVTMWISCTVSSETDNPSSLQLPSSMHEVWVFDLPEELRARIYQSAVLSDTLPLVLASTTNDILRIAGDTSQKGKAVSLFHSRDLGRIGESVKLPSSTIATSLLETPVGFILHKHNVIARLRVVTLAGSRLAEVTDQRHFQYRLAPDGNSFVGIDAGGKLGGFSAATVIYRFFSRSGKLIGEVESSPASGTDSIYSPDGKSYLINSRKQGLSSYNPNSAKRLWNISAAIKFFASANGNVSRVVVAKAENRHEAQLYEAGRLIWTMDLQRFGTNKYVRNVGISPNGEVAAVSSDKEILIFGADSPTPTGRFQVKGELSINSLEINNRGMVVVGSQARIKGTESGFGKAFILDKSGKLLYQRNTQHQRVNAWIPTLQFDPSGRFLLIQTLESLVLLAVY